VAQSNSAFTRAASLAQLVLALGPSPRPCRRAGDIDRQQRLPGAQQQQQCHSTGLQHGG